MKKKTVNIITKPSQEDLAKILSKTAMQNVESVGTAMLQTGQEFLLAIEQVLMDHFGFTEEDLKKFHKELEYILVVARQAEGMGLSAIGPRTMRAVADIAEIRKQRELASKSGISLPQPSKEEIIKKLIKN